MTGIGARALIKRKIITSLFITLFLLTANFFGLGGDIKDIFHQISAFPQKILLQGGNSLKNYFSDFSTIKNYSKEYEKWRKEKENLLAEISVLKDLQKENKQLRIALNLGLGKKFKLAQVTAFSADAASGFIFIDGGKEQGIKKGFPVITSSNVLVGSVNKVYSNHSLVELISNKGVSFGASYLKKDISGIIKGQGNLQLSWEDIPKDKKIILGVAVVTSRLSGFYPSGLLIGEISKIEKRDIEPFQKAEIKPFFSFGRDNILFVILNF